MNKITKILISILLISVATYFLVVNKPWKSFAENDYDFAITDTASITKIFMASARGGTVLLEKKDQNHWLVNGSTPADLPKIQLLLETLHDVQMRNPVGDNEYNNVIKEMTAAAVKTEVYAGEKLIKVIYVGQMTSDQTGTYLMLEDAKPYVAHIPGFVGYLTPRFLVEPIKWKSKLIFDYQASDINYVQVSFPSQPKENFTVDNQSELPKLLNGAGEVIAIDSNYLKYYLGSFLQLYAEGYDDNYTAIQQDSISSSIPFCTVKVKLKSSEEVSLRLFSKQIDKRTKQRYDESGNPLPLDTEKYFGFKNNDRSMMYVQDYNFGKIIRGLSYIKEITAKASAMRKAQIQ